MYTASPCTNKSDELTTVIEYKDENYIPINAVFTRNKARQLADIKAPDFSLQIPVISPEKFKEMQQSDKSFDRFWKIAKGQTIKDDKMKADFIIKKGLLFRKPVRPRGLGIVVIPNWLSLPT